MLEINIHKAIVGNLSHQELMDRVGLTREEGIIVFGDKQFRYDDIKISVLKEIIQKVQEAADEGKIQLRDGKKNPYFEI